MRVLGDWVRKDKLKFWRDTAVRWSVVALFSTVAAPRGARAEPKAAASSSAAQELLLEPECVGPCVSPPVTREVRLSSGYGMRKSRLGNKRLFHAGLDFAARMGAPVFAVRPGIVEKVSRDRRKKRGFRGYGNAIVVYHPDEDRWSLYAHLHKIHVKPGQQVAAGQIIGRVGATSNGKFPGMGAHLHFEVRKRARRGRRPFPGPSRVNNVDPARWLARHGVLYGRSGYLAEGDETAIAVETDVPE